jgi:lysophospholipase L1-like esterase
MIPMNEDTRMFIASLYTTKPNEYDEDAMERGYYEDLADVSRANPQLGAILQQRPTDWKKLEDTDALVPTGDYRLKELAPSRTTTLNGFTMTTNRWGMRDRDYPMKKPSGTFRIAVMDASSTMGWGVGDGQAFENVLEDRLNAKPPLTGFSRYEILNFGVNGYSTLCDLVTLEKKVLAFKPDAVIFQANVTDDYWAAQRLVKSLRAGVEPPYDFVKRIVADAGINGLMPEQAALRRLQPFRWDLIESAYARFAAVARDNGAVPAWFLLPRLLHQSEHKRQAVANLNRYARDAGFIILDVSDVFKNHDPDRLALAPWDTHPNVKGHELLADALYRALQTDAASAVWRGGAVAPIEPSSPQGN